MIERSLCISHADYTIGRPCNVLPISCADYSQYIQYVGRYYLLNSYKHQ